MKLQTALPVAMAAAVGSALVLPDLEESSHQVAKHVAHALETARDTSSSVLASFTKEITKTAADKGEAVRLAPLVAARENYFAIPHRYIVVFKSSVSPQEADFHKEIVSEAHLQSVAKLPLQDAFFDATTGRQFDAEEYEGEEDVFIANTPEGGIQDSFDLDGLLHGYIGYFPSEVVDFIRMNPLVDFVEQDSMVFAQEFDTQNGAPWGLSRISHREKLNLGSFNKYLYDDAAGKGVTSYVIDTGVNVDHKDFEGRAIWGKTIPTNDLDQDGNGHGTHCAGTIASKHYGVAKNAEVVAVKVLRSNGSGSMSDVVKGVEFAAKSHQDAVKSNKKGFKGSTANMSLGGGKSPALDMAVNAAVKAGLHFAVAAGNENQDACNTSPASAENAITVGASTLADDRAYFSNWGKCVDIFAPGLNVLSTYIGSETATATLSGTSMASPHVAGLLTYFLSLQPDSDSEFYHAAGGITPAQLKKKLVAYSTKNVLGDLPEDTVNYLIYNGAGQDLDDFWSVGESDKQEKTGEDSKFQETVAAEFENFIDSLEEKTDVLYEEIREVFDEMNIL
ncbi:LANO_0A06876g1_1 [Lachancea nothofagi CBS 11611]|uniref:LANO_0A06876g1_1 n=1 Tax=Lachancea nothofagi CBS 11611 TaxID=1266666 RepID=A0A1G4ISC1_9SACH|nr:LANO_0A06876g1_1 [Lachancea nothofagi CBS 11611]